MKASLVLPIVAMLGLASCSSAPTKSMPTEKVTVSQIGDTKMSCEKLEGSILTVQKQTSDMVEINQQRAEGQFLTSSIANVTLSLLSPSSANNRIAQKNGFNNDEAIRLASLQQQHNHLLNIAKDKKCLFASDVESKLNSAESNVKEPSFRQRNHN